MTQYTRFFAIFLALALCHCNGAIRHDATKASTAETDKAAAKNTPDVWHLKLALSGVMDVQSVVQQSLQPDSFVFRCARPLNLLTLPASSFNVKWNCQRTTNRQINYNQLDQYAVTGGEYRIAGNGSRHLTFQTLKVTESQSQAGAVFNDMYQADRNYELSHSIELTRTATAAASEIYRVQANGMAIDASPGFNWTWKLSAVLQVDSNTAALTWTNVDLSSDVIIASKDIKSSFSANSLTSSMNCIRPTGSGGQFTFGSDQSGVVLGSNIALPDLNMSADWDGCTAWDLPFQKNFLRAAQALY